MNLDLNADLLIGLALGIFSVIAAAVVGVSILSRRQNAKPDPRHPSQWSPEMELRVERSKDFR